MTNVTNEFQIALDNYVKAVQAKVTFRARIEQSQPATITYDLASASRRYVRILAEDDDCRSVHSFVDTIDGAVLKADGWKRPSKLGASGNIFSATHGAEALELSGSGEASHHGRKGRDPGEELQRRKRREQEDRDARARNGMKVDRDPAGERWSVKECRRQMQRHHPDKGGDADEFQLWRGRYEQAKSSGPRM